MLRNWKNIICYFLSFSLLVPSILKAETIIGGETIYLVKKGDSLEFIGAKFGVDWRKAAKENNIIPDKILRIGQELKLNNRKIVPKTIDNGIIINIPDRMLYFFKDGKLDMSFPVGLGMPSWRGITRWRTPEGEFTVTNKRKYPTWRVPKSMQWKMIIEGKPIRKVVPPGPDNPLGRYAINTSFPGIVIHETIWPTTVYQFRSHGCIRVLPEYAEDFFNMIEINTAGEIIYKPIKVAVFEGKVFLEVHRDIYGKFKDLRDETRRIFKEHSLLEKVDWQKVDLVLQEKTGIAEDVSL